MADAYSYVMVFVPVALRARAQVLSLRWIIRIEHGRCFCPPLRQVRCAEAI